MSESHQNPSKTNVAEETHRGYVPTKPDPNADKQGFKENQKVRIKDLKSSDIWLIDKAYLRGKHWKYVLKNPDGQQKVYNGGEEVEEKRLRSAG